MFICQLMDTDLKSHTTEKEHGEWLSIIEEIEKGGYGTFVFIATSSVSLIQMLFDAGGKLKKGTSIDLCTSKR